MISHSSTKVRASLKVRDIWSKCINGKLMNWSFFWLKQLCEGVKDAKVVGALRELVHNS